MGINDLVIQSIEAALISKINNCRILKDSAVELLLKGYKKEGCRFEICVIKQGGKARIGERGYIRISRLEFSHINGGIAVFSNVKNASLGIHIPEILSLRKKESGKLFKGDTVEVLCYGILTPKA